MLLMRFLELGILVRVSMLSDSRLFICLRVTSLHFSSHRHLLPCALAAVVFLGTDANDLFCMWNKQTISLVCYLLFGFAGQRVIGEPVASGLVLDDSKLWDPDFKTAAQCAVYHYFFIYLLQNLNLPLDLNIQRFICVAC